MSKALCLFLFIALILHQTSSQACEDKLTTPGACQEIKNLNYCQMNMADLENFEISYGIFCLEIYSYFFRFVQKDLWILQGA